VQSPIQAAQYFIPVYTLNQHAAWPPVRLGLDFIFRQREKLTIRNRKKYNLPYKENGITSALLFAPAAAISGKIQKTVVKKYQGEQHGIP
jgi:hypothetical protein